jgi:hypothetical protein
MKWRWFGPNDDEHLFVSAWLTVTLLTVVFNVGDGALARAALSGAEITPLLDRIGDPCGVYVRNSVLRHEMGMVGFE